MMKKLRFLLIIIFVLVLTLPSRSWDPNTSLSNASASFIGENSQDASGGSVSYAGDINGDGYGDFLISAHNNDENGVNAGQVYLIFGKSSGWNMDIFLSNADASFLGENSGDAAGISVSSAGDVNADGYHDFLVGASYNDEKTELAGQVYLILGKASGWNMDMNLSQADASFLGENYGDWAGRAVASAGDVNGDGYDDFIIGAYGSDEGSPERTNRGQVYLIFGKASGWSLDTDLSQADASFWGERANDFAGLALAGVGDVNGDDFDDIIIAADGNDENGDTAGQVYLILGKASGWSLDTNLSQADASFWGEYYWDEAGESVTRAGDVNCDGYDDLLIGAYYNSEGGSRAGQVYLILGSKAGWGMDTNLSQANASFWGESASDNAGENVSFVGDVNGDNFDDILIGAWFNDDVGNMAGKAYLIFGKESGWNRDTNLSNSDASFLGENANDLAGTSVSYSGDVNGDGFNDFIIGANGNSEGGQYAGQSYLLLSDQTGASNGTYKNFITSGNTPQVKFPNADVTLDFSAATSSNGYVTVTEHNNQNPPDAGSNVFNRYWTISGTGLSGYTYDLTIKYNDGEITESGVAESDLKLAYKNGGSWTVVSTTVDASHNRISTTGLTHFSDWAVGSEAAFTSFDIVSHSPAQNALAVAKNTDIQVQFNLDVNSSTINANTFVVHASQTGLHAGTYSYNSGTKTATLNPINDFAVGERVTVTLTTGIQTTTGAPLSNSYEWSFTIEVDGGTGTFQTKTDYQGSDAISVFCAELDADGDIDLAVANYYTNTVSVFLNNGDGTFQTKTDYSTGNGYPYPFNVVSSDLNSDGHMDLVVVNVNNNTISIFLNNGDGTFPTRTDYSTSSGPLSSFTADLDGDGDKDLAISNQGSNSVSVFLNNGDGTFPTKADYAIGVEPQSVFSSDFDGDGDMDLVAVNQLSHTVSILLNKGDGTFQTKTDFGTGNYPKSVFSSDLDGDGDMDLAVANYSPGSVSILLNNGDGTFQTKTDYGAGNEPRSVFSSDFDGDDDMDLVVSNSISNTVSILLNNGDGTFQTKTDYAAGDEPWFISSADFDGDGDMDLAVPNKRDNTISILMNINSSDSMPPGNVTNLSVSSVTATSATLTWSAPGDDGSTGTATTYDIRYSTSSLSETNWASVDQVEGEPSPQVAGSSETFTVSGLSGNTSYYFGIKTSDEVPNESGLSNIASTTTNSLHDDPGYEINLDGSDYVHIPQDAVLQTRNSMTIEAWIRCEDPTRAQQIFDENNGYYNHIELSLRNNAGVRFAHQDTIFDTGSSIISANQWTHVAGVYDSENNTGKIYINGSLVAVTGEDVNTTGTAYDVAIGSFSSGAYPGYKFKGQIDEVRHWNVARTTTQIQNSYNHCVDKSEPNLVGYWQFDNTANDSTSNGNNGTLMGDPSYVWSTAPFGTDNTAPSAVADLSVSSATANSATLSWTAPGDDGNTGIGVEYDVRYSTSTITTGNWDSANNPTGEPVPQMSGNSESYTVSGLSANTAYYFAMKTRDNGSNWSDLSNVTSRNTNTIIVSDNTWKSTTTEQSGWYELNFDDSSWDISEAPYHNAYGANPQSWLSGTTAQWMWHSNGAVTCFFRKAFGIANLPTGSTATLKISVDDDYDVYLNETKVAENWNGTTQFPGETVSIGEYLREGRNVVAIKGNDTWGGNESVLLELHLSPEIVSCYWDQEPASVGSTISFNEGSGSSGDDHSVDLMFTNMTGSGNVQVEQTNGAPSDSPCLNVSGNFWSIEIDATITSFSTDITFHYTDADATGYTESNAFFGIAKFNSSTNTWQWLGGTVDATNNTVTVSGVTSFSAFALYRRIFGDITGDGYVDAADLQRLGDCWHSTNSGEFTGGSDARFFNFNKNTDSGNQIIDAADLQVFGDCWHNGVQPGSFK